MTSADQPVVYLTHEEHAALLDELKILNNAGIVEIAVRNSQVMEYMQHWEGRAEKAEAERDRLREALKVYGHIVKEYADNEPFVSDPAYDWLNEDGGRLARAALKGDQT